MRRERVMVVDDEPDVREMLQAALEEMGYDCAAAPDADTALRLLAAQPVDLMLLDVMMPKRSGVDLFRDVMQTHPATAVVFITARADLNVAVDTLRSGAYDYLMKPVSLDRLERVVKQTLAKRRALLERASHQKSLEENVAHQDVMLQNYTRQLEGLNRLMQSQISEQIQLQEAAETLARAARSTAELLLKLADEATSHMAAWEKTPLLSTKPVTGSPQA